MNGVVNEPIIEVRGQPAGRYEFNNTFFPDTIIEDGKNICGVTCKLWNKQLDLVINAMKHIELEKKEIEAITIDNIYEFYIKWGKRNSY